MSFVPMYLSSMNRAVDESHSSDPFQFSPSAAAVAFAKTDQPANGSTNRNRLNVSNLADQLEIHRPRIESPFHQKFYPLPAAGAEKPRLASARVGPKVFSSRWLAVIYRRHFFEPESPLVGNTLRLRISVQNRTCRVESTGVAKGKVCHDDYANT